MKIFTAPKSAVSAHQYELANKLIEVLERCIEDTDIEAPEALGAVLSALTWLIAATSAELHGGIANGLKKAIPQVMANATELQQAAITPN